MDLLSIPFSRRSSRVTPKQVISSHSLPAQEQPFLPAEQIVVIPQFSGTCWFNAILMAMLYSQGLRSFVYKEAKLWAQWDSNLKNNKFKKTLLFILKHNYTNPKKIEELFQKRVKPELLLFSYLDYYHSSETKDEKETNMIKMLKTNLNAYVYAYYQEFINEIFSNIFRNTLDYLDIYFIGTDIYLGKSKTSIDISKIDISSLKPKVLLLYHQDFYYSSGTGEDYYKFITEVDIDKGYKLPRNISHSGINTYQQTIKFNGHNYQLDCCIINNHNIKAIKKGHTILGLTYGNQPYVYNGWTIATPSEITHEYGKKSKGACKLFFFDWKNDLYLSEGSRGFCISRKDCDSLKEVDEEDLCYDFSKKTDRKILIYVKVDDEERVALPATSSLVLTSSNTPEKLNYSSESVKKFIDKYHKLKEKTFNELSELFIQNTSYTIAEISLLFSNPGLKNFKILFFILCGRRLTEPITEDDKKAILIALIELYLKDDKIIFFNFLGDDKIHEYLTEETLTTALEKIGYEQLLDEILVHADLIKTVYLFLFQALLFSYQYTPTNTTEPNKKDFLFLLLKAYVIDGYLFDLDLYTDENILRKVFSNLKKLDEINTQIKADGNYQKKTTDIYLLISEKITISFELEFAGLQEDKKEILKTVINLAIFVMYFIGIARLKEIMEPVSLISSTTGQAGGSKKKQLKSYKKVNNAKLNYFTLAPSRKKIQRTTNTTIIRKS